MMSRDTPCSTSITGASRHFAALDFRRIMEAFTHIGETTLFRCVEGPVFQTSFLPDRGLTLILPNEQS